MAYESKDKMVSHPDHYQAKNGMEVINVIEAFTEGLNGIEAACAANIIKYACRWKNKNGIQDLEKIMWYTQHLIDHLKTKEGTGTFKVASLQHLDGSNGLATKKPNETISFSFTIPADDKEVVKDLTKIPEVDASNVIEKSQIVKVVHIDYNGGVKNNGFYYFLTKDDVKVDDIVECDTKHGVVLGRIVKTENENYNDIFEDVYVSQIRVFKFCRKRKNA